MYSGDSCTCVTRWLRTIGLLIISFRSQDVSYPRRCLLLCVFPLLPIHLGVLPLQAPSKSEAAKHRNPGHDGVDGEGQGVLGRILLVVQVRRPNLCDYGSGWNPSNTPRDPLFPRELIVAYAAARLARGRAKVEEIHASATLYEPNIPPTIRKREK